MKLRVKLVVLLAVVASFCTALGVGTAQAWITENCTVPEFSVHHDYSPSVGGYFYMVRPRAQDCDGMSGIWYEKSRSRLRTTDNSYVGAWDVTNPCCSWPYIYVGGSGPGGHDPTLVNFTPQTEFDHNIGALTGKQWVIDVEMYITSTNNVYMFHVTHTYGSFGAVVNADTDIF